MAKFTINIPDNVIRLSKAIIHDEKTRMSFDEDPVGVLKEYGIEIPDDLTNEKLKEMKLLDLKEQCENTNKTALRSAAAVEAGIEATMTPYTYPVTLVLVGVAACTTVGKEE